MKKKEYNIIKKSKAIITGADKFIFKGWPEI